MIDLRFVPLEKPIERPKGGYKRSPFGVGFSRLLDDLERELGYLTAKGITVEAGVAREDIRNDGWPRSSAKYSSPGIRLSFGSRHGPLAYECATYSSMEGNLRAISQTLTAQRAMERYGAVKSGQQYKGWKALPEGAGQGPIIATAFGSTEEAARFLLRTALLNDGDTQRVIDDPEYLRTVYRAAAKRTHPDVLAGNTDLFAQVNSANQMIEVEQSRLAAA